MTAMRPALFCNTCNSEFSDEAAQKSHYRSDWHQYNLRRKVAGVPGITEALFNLRVEAVAAEKKKLEGGQSLVYKCSLCNREYCSTKAHAQHLTSKQHIQKVSGHPSVSTDEITVTRLASERPLHSDHEKKASAAKVEEEESSDEWEEVNENEDMAVSGSLDNSEDEDSAMSVEDMGQWDVTQCFFCDLIADGTVEGCVEHMHKQHGFFIPDSEYLKDPRGLLNYLGLKVTKGLMCLYCDERGKQFQSLEAVRKHMLSKSHCKLHYGDDGVEEELGDFYDFSSNSATEEGSQMMVVAETVPVSLSSGGSELVIRHDTSSKHSIKIIGSRDFARYYKQRPRPSDNRDGVLVNSLVARYRSMGLATRHSHQPATNLKETKRLPQFQAESMRTKLGLKNNVIRNLPKNVTF